MTGRHRGSSSPQPSGGSGGGETGLPGAPFFGLAEAADPSPGNGRIARTPRTFAARSNAVWLVIGAALVAVVVGLLMLDVDGSRKPRPGTAEALPSATAQPERPAPQQFPTYGKVVPPRAVATQTVSVPVPKATPKPAPTRRDPRGTSPDARMRCPQDWWQKPPLRKWCEQQGLAP